MIPIVEKQVALNPNEEFQLRLANAYRNNKQYDKAIELFRKIVATQSKPKSRHSALQIGHLLLQSGKKDEAIAWMKENFDVETPTLEDYNHLGNFYQSMTLPETAEDFFLKSAALGRSPEEKSSITN